jgi:spore morphogenesis protein SipL
VIILLRNFINVVGIADPSQFPTILPTNPNIQQIVEEELLIPDAKPDVEQINTVLIEATIKASRAIVTPVGLKIVVDGELNQKIIYTADDLVQSVHSAHYTEPFCTYIEVPLTIPAGLNVIEYLQSLGLTLDDVIVSPSKVLIEDVSVKLLDERTIEKCTVLFIWASINPLLIPIP